MKNGIVLAHKNNVGCKSLSVLVRLLSNYRRIVYKKRKERFLVLKNFNVKNNKNKKQSKKNFNKRF